MSMQHSTRASLTHPETQQAMLEGIERNIRAKLRERIIAAIEPEIAAAIDDVIRDMKPAIQSFLEPEQGRLVINLILQGRIKDAG
jgi:hypothetical protein